MAQFIRNLFQFIFWLALFLVPWVIPAKSNDRNLISTKIRVCLSQCGVLQASIEQYDMDAESNKTIRKTGKVKELFSELITQKYVEEWPECPSGGTYYWTGVNKNNIPDYCKGVYKTGKKVNIREVQCSKHGSNQCPVNPSSYHHPQPAKNGPDYFFYFIIVLTLMALYKAVTTFVKTIDSFNDMVKDSK